MHRADLEPGSARLVEAVGKGIVAALRAFAAEDEIPLERTIAIGDGANDLDMLTVAGFGIAFNAKPVLAGRADAVVRGRLDDVLTLAPFLATSGL